MNADLYRLRLEQLQTALTAYAPLVALTPPRRGWLKAIREALGRSGPQQAQRLGIAAPTLYKCEQSEADERITLSQLRKLAEGLDCDLVYALVPRRPLTAMVSDRAYELANLEVKGVAHTMSLEDQRPSNAVIDRQIEQRVAELLKGRWSDLWR